MNRESNRDWYFTFGSDHQHPRGYVKIYGTFHTARDEMMRRYGSAWAFQYESARDAGVERYGLYEVK